MPTCDNCGAFVTVKYRRVFEVDGSLNGCQNCQNRNEHGDNLV